MPQSQQAHSPHQCLWRDRHDGGCGRRRCAVRLRLVRWRRRRLAPSAGPLLPRLLECWRRWRCLLLFCRRRAVCSLLRLPLCLLHPEVLLVVAALAHPVLTCDRVAVPVTELAAAGAVGAAQQALPALLLPPLPPLLLGCRQKPRSLLACRLPLCCIEAGAAQPACAADRVRSPAGCCARSWAVAAALQAAHAHGAHLPAMVSHVLPAGAAKARPAGGVAPPAAACAVGAAVRAHAPLLLLHRPFFLFSPLLAYWPQRPWAQSLLQRCCRFGCNTAAAAGATAAVATAC